MKVLVITDIHQHVEAANMAHITESPDLVLDCGDHEELTNLFDLTPHFYVKGNHEPSKVKYRTIDGPLPTLVVPEQIIEISDGKSNLRVTGLSGNYSEKQGKIYEPAVTIESIDKLRYIPTGGVDVILVHQSPLQVKTGSLSYDLAQRALEQIRRISPRYVFSGHKGEYSVDEDEHTAFISLDDMAEGYGILNVDGRKFDFKRKIAVQSRKGRNK